MMSNLVVLKNDYMKDSSDCMEERIAFYKNYIKYC